MYKKASDSIEKRICTFTTKGKKGWEEVCDKLQRGRFQRRCPWVFCDTSETRPDRKYPKTAEEESKLIK